MIFAGILEGHSSSSAGIQGGGMPPQPKVTRETFQLVTSCHHGTPG
jgi:hypothetical protein